MRTYNDKFILSTSQGYIKSSVVLYKIFISFVENKNNNLFVGPLAFIDGQNVRIVCFY